MSYTALARKWRPRSFAELVGQEHVVRALSNGLATGRVHHAFLFAGTRGVGKTTLARIFAKCLNCETGVSPTPCGVCSACREIDEGRFVDLIEVDAASRTKVDDTRELLDNVQYSPASGRYKVYLIDEVHMLSNHSFNALLKTLEEPPPHVKFLLATTDPQKLPVTILSRCLQFNLKRLPVALIAERMRGILAQEGIEAEAPAIRLLAQAADGSMRDGLSLLDQLLAFGGGRAAEQDARAMLGSVDRGAVADLMGRIAAGDAHGVLAICARLAELSVDPAQTLDALATLLARVALRQQIPEYEGDELHDAAELDRFAGLVTAEEVQLYYQIAILGRRDLPLAPDPATGLEMTLLRMLAFRPVTGTGDAALASGAAVPAMTAGVRTAPDQSGTPPATQLAGQPSPASTQASATGSSRSTDEWIRTVAQLDLAGIARQLASQCTLKLREGSRVVLLLDPRAQHLQTRAQEDKLAQALSRLWQMPVRLEFELAPSELDTPHAAESQQRDAERAAARQSLEEDPTVQGLRQQFGATLLEASVQPNPRGSGSR